VGTSLPMNCLKRCICDQPLQVIYRLRALPV
jgi:hypothetical protein